jgi:hypothetical protein
MRLADARRPEQDDILAVLDEPTRRQRLDLFAIHRRLVALVKRLEPLHERKASAKILQLKHNQLGGCPVAC